ncbi:hypothetical protein C9374_001321 [Naegleria lovaniensis]|uniref:RNA polymerase II-associated protein 1 n=1 Tax=Naegleria lovaniensis TaxID=51637 RepID=A0AA88GRV7_NAELO|nr:uncharacterized protein C9374_001321 [Naegleria lovaniensis]KAG2387727.1 hypothetical protein C9374_001321 [Naegleria lovaniensis]
MKPSSLSTSRNKNALKRAGMVGVSFEQDDEEQAILNQRNERLSRDQTEDDDDLFQAQERFFKQQSEPAASVTKKSKFALEREKKKKEEANAASNAPKSVLSIFNNLNIVERDVQTKSVIPPSLPTQPQAFPTLKQPTLTFLGRKRVQPEKQSVQQSHKDEMNISDEDTVTQHDVKPTEGLSEADAIDQESDRMLSKMSKLEIEEAKSQLMKQFDPSIINMLKNRGAEKKLKKQHLPKHFPPQSEGKTSQTRNDTSMLSAEERKEIAEKDISEIIDKIKESLNPKELKNIKEEEEKLKWIVGGEEFQESEEEKNDKSKFKPLRFDLEGNIVDQSKEYPSHSGLFHHGRDQNMAGYTILEIFQLIRSSVITQRIINIKLLNQIILKSSSSEKIELLIYLEEKYELFKTIFWFGYADALNASATVLHKNLSLIRATSELFRTILSCSLQMQQDEFDIIERNSFNYFLTDVNNTVSEKIDFVRKYEKDVTPCLISNMVTILECEDDPDLRYHVIESLIILSRYSLSIATKISNEMTKKKAFKQLTSSNLFINTTELTQFALLISNLSRHGKNICERLIKNTDVIDIAKKNMIICSSPSKTVADSQLLLCTELLSIVTCCTSYKMLDIMHLFCEEMFPNLVALIQLPFAKSFQKSQCATELSQTCLNLLQVYMTSKSSLSFPSFEDKDEVDENSIGHLENFALSDCPLLAIKSLTVEKDSLCIRFLYFICTFYDNFYCNPNSDFHRFIAKEDIDKTSQLLMVMKRVENRTWYTELYNWGQKSIDQLKDLNVSKEHFATVSNLLSNISSIVTLCYFCAKSFKHMFTILFDELHFEHLLSRLYDEVFQKYLFNKDFFSFAAESPNPLRTKFYILRERFFNMTYYLLKLYSYEKTKLSSLFTQDQICNLGLFSAALLDPFNIRGDRSIFFFILQTYVLQFNPTFLNYLDKDAFDMSTIKEINDIVESNNLQVGAPSIPKEHISVTPTNWMYSAIEHYYINRLDETKNIPLIMDNLKFITSLSYGTNYRSILNELNQGVNTSFTRFSNQGNFINVFFPKVIQFANMMKVFLLDSSIFFVESIQNVLQTWIDIYYYEQYTIQINQSQKVAQTPNNPFHGFANMASMEDIFCQMFKDFVEHQVSASFNQLTFSQFVLSFFIHTNIWNSKYRMYIANEMSAKQINFLRADESWLEKLQVFPSESDLDLIILYLKKFISPLTLEEINSSFMYRYMIHHIVNSIPSLSVEWKIENREVLSSLMEAISNEKVKDFILSKIAQRDGVGVQGLLMAYKTNKYL